MILADKLYRLLYGKGRECQEDPEEALVKRGWLVIHKETSFTRNYLFRFHGHLSAEQIRTIRPACEDSWHWIEERSRMALQEEFEA